MRICFFARVRDRNQLELIQWYRNDIKILKNLGETKIATKLSEIPLNSDVYCSWWCTTSVYSLMIALLRRKPLIVLGHGSEVARDRGANGGFFARPFWQRAVISFVLRHASAVFAVSKAGLDDLKALGASNPYLVPLAVDTSVYTVERVESSKPLIFTVSHLNAQNINRKCIRQLIKAIPDVLEAFPEARFVIAGRKYDSFNELFREVLSLGIQDAVEFPGEIDTRTKLDYYAKAWVYAQPSLHEAFGVAIAEAMSCGVPVVVSNVGAVKEVVGPHGLYVDGNNPKAIAEAIVRLLRDSNMRFRLGRAGRSWVTERFPLSARAEAVVRVFKALGILG